MVTTASPPRGHVQQVVREAHGARQRHAIVHAAHRGRAAEGVREVHALAADVHLRAMIGVVLYTAGVTHYRRIHHRATGHRLTGSNLTPLPNASPTHSTPPPSPHLQALQPRGQSLTIQKCHPLHTPPARHHTCRLHSRAASHKLSIQAFLHATSTHGTPLLPPHLQAPQTRGRVQAWHVRELRKMGCKKARDAACVGEGVRV